MSAALYRCLAILLLLVPGGAQALNIQLDYTYDTFFATHAAAKTTLEAAAADLNAAITSTLGAMPTDTFTGTSGGSSATADWSLSFNNPTTGAAVTLTTPTAAADVFKVFVGMRSLTDPALLGVGGPGGAGVSVGGTSFGASSFTTAVGNMQTASNAVMMRGAGPVVGSLSGSISGNAYTLNYGSFIGNLWFDNDSDNNGAADSDSLLNNYWNFSLAAPTTGQNDFYSVALHEIMHSLGLGASATWTSQRSGTNWLGSNAIAANGGSGTGLVTTDGHIASGKMSFRLSDGVAQEVVMDPSLTTGTRKSLTVLDLAFLRDLGYTTIPEPGVAILWIIGAGSLAGRRRRGGSSG